MNNTIKENPGYSEDITVLPPPPPTSNPIELSNSNENLLKDENQNNLNQKDSPTEVYQLNHHVEIIGEIIINRSESAKVWKYAKYFPGGYNPKRQLPLKGKSLNTAINLVAGLAIMFYGFDQGVMSGVNNTGDYRRLMGVDSSPQTARDSAAIGGIVAVYYIGTLVGALVAGSLGDRIGRLRTIVFGCLFAAVGASLQASSQSIVWMCLARVITGFGTGNLNAIVPVWTSEICHHTNRGAALGFEFFLNILGLVIAYWTEFGLRNGNQSFRWRFPLALQIVFIVGLLILVPLFPESPRWLVKVGEVDKARHILNLTRSSGTGDVETEIELELEGIIAVAANEQLNVSKPTYWSMITKQDSQHLRRRTWLVIWLQILQELVGIGVVTVYAPDVFQLAGSEELFANLLTFFLLSKRLSGINNVSYMFSVLVAVFTLDRMGRRVTLYWGAIVMGLALFLAGISTRYAIDTNVPTEVRSRWGSVLIACIFVYTATFGATWLTVPWLYPTEIMPNSCRSKGGAWSVVGWSIGNGIVTEITPFLLNAIGFWTFILFGGLCIFTIPNIYFLYPETAGRSLEDMDVLFESDTIFVHSKTTKFHPTAKKGEMTLEMVNPDGHVPWVSIPINKSN
ncbi:uncharacterized protein MELLADRAFT_92386 [Melampsora larici-populina 98AG31]|uniref:Major facilitator superfamily (MFS) profile domain-containing protein n=1 Tax=Melampsora larici-populina (strain 98AG31 / pathotype 3-4-7) TaxID=747676 RepID=F4R9F9_MELLP|nr:uncharacterized protein MELLADRAFT_92386 [Melampsora larici-populina 98AG31]EGG10976.1 hypothetical protein MELLADRAFT_92386 [Melampsora larici-populina 98AG31]